jgi:hypothetical protein
MKKTLKTRVHRTHSKDNGKQKKKKKHKRKEGKRTEGKG